MGGLAFRGHDSLPSVDVESPIPTDKDGLTDLQIQMPSSPKILMTVMGFDPLCRTLGNAIKGRRMGYDPDRVQPFEDSDADFAARLRKQEPGRAPDRSFRVGDQVCKRFALRSNLDLINNDSDVGVVVGILTCGQLQVRWDGPSCSVDLMSRDEIRTLPAADPRHFTEGAQVQLFIYDEWDRRGHTVVGFTADGDVQIVRPLGTNAGIYPRWRIRKVPEHSDV